MYIHVHIYFSIILFSPQTYSIEFDRDFDYFAIAGVTKKIKVLLSLFILFLAYFITSRISEIVIVAKNPSFCYLSSFDEYLWQSAIQGDLCIRASSPSQNPVWIWIPCSSKIFLKTFSSWNRRTLSVKFKNWALSFKGFFAGIKVAISSRPRWDHLVCSC